MSKGKSASSPAVIFEDDSQQDRIVLLMRFQRKRGGVDSGIHYLPKIRGAEEPPVHDERSRVNSKGF